MGTSSSAEEIEGKTGFSDGLIQMLKSFHGWAAGIVGTSSRAEEIEGGKKVFVAVC